MAAPANASTDQQSHPARAQLGFFSVVLLGINGIIGAGIFLTPGEVIKVGGTAAPWAYAVGALFALVLALTFATGARYVRTNGASYAYTRAGFGDRVAIYVGVTHAFVGAIAWGTLASFAVTTILQVAFPDKDWAAQTSFWSVKTLAFAIFILFLLAINYFGNSLVKWANGISTIGKITALLVFIVGAVVVVASRGSSNYAAAGGPEVYGGDGEYALLGFVPLGSGAFASLVLAILVALYAYTGFENIPNAAEEMKDPDSILPRAIPLAVLSVAGIYLLVVIGAMMAAPEKIANSTETVGLAAVFDDPLVHAIIVVGAIVSLVGINIAASFGNPRLFTALSDHGLLPRVLSRKGRHGVPLVAFTVTALLAIAFPIALSYDPLELTGLAVVARFVQFLIVPLAIIQLTRGRGVEQMPGDVRSGRVLGYVLPAIAVLFTLFLLLSFNFKEILTSADGGPNVLSIALLALAFVIAPALVYLGRSRRSRSEALSQ